MKEKIFMYLFIFALMFVLFQYTNSKRYSEAKQNEIAVLHKEIDSLQTTNNPPETTKKDSEQSDSREGFSLKTNSYAREFFEDQNMDVDSLEAEIENQIISQNQAEEDNPLVPYSASEGKTMSINRIKVLNNRWILAAFTDGQTWGEAIISYYLDEDNNLKFDTEDGVLHGN